MKKLKQAAAPSRAATPSAPHWITGVPADMTSAMLMEEHLVRSLEKATAGDGDIQATYKLNSRLTRCFKTFGVPDDEIPRLTEFVVLQGGNVDILSQVALLAKTWREAHAQAVPTEADESAWRPAGELWKTVPYKEFEKQSVRTGFHKEHAEMVRYKSKHRPEIHAGRFAEYWTEYERKLAENASLQQQFNEEVRQRYQETRAERTGKGELK